MLALDSRSQIEDITRRAEHLWKYLDVENKQREIQRLEDQLAQPGFWDDQERAQKIIKTANQLKKTVNKIVDYRAQLEDLKVVIELLEASEDEDTTTHAEEIVNTVAQLADTLDALEIESFLSEPHDHCNAILSINSGAGGTESCDWADMLLRLYTRWAERRGYSVEIQDLQRGDEAGISSATFRVIGPNAYGNALAERGVHRLVRISPFDSGARRHTSFSSVDVIAEIEDDVEIEVKDEDIRIDTFRASGKGGQHVNKTDSAVRITHMPTNIVVSCQNERSQLKNRATAMKVLKSRLYEKMQDEKRTEREKFYSDKGDIAWGSQIRSYVFQPYQMVKDLRTGVETGNVQAVMDGDIDRFIHAWLRAGRPTSRSKEN